MSAAIVLPELPDLLARRRALLVHSTTLLVEAGAGSGKTALMAGRVALILAAGIPIRLRLRLSATGDPHRHVHGRNCLRKLAGHPPHSFQR